MKNIKRVKGLKKSGQYDEHTWAIDVRLKLGKTRERRIKRILKKTENVEILKKILDEYRRE